MNGRVLLVEDDQAMGEMLEVHLRRRGFSVILQPSAEQSLAVLRSEDFDVVACRGSSRKGGAGILVAGGREVAALPVARECSGTPKYGRTPVVLTAFDRVAPEDLPDRVRTHRRTQLVLGGDDPSTFLPMHEVERRYILHVRAHPGRSAGPLPGGSAAAGWKLSRRRTERNSSRSTGLSKTARAPSASASR
jgi:CheY-like chemotaxis protein